MENINLDTLAVIKLSEKERLFKIYILYFFRYKRIFSVGTLGITTYNPQSLEITNQVWYC